MILLCISLIVYTLPVTEQVPHAPDPRPTRPDTVGVRQLLRTAQQWSTADTPGAARLSQEVLGLARQVCDLVGEGLALLRLSTLHRRHNDFALAWLA